MQRDKASGPSPQVASICAYNRIWRYRLESGKYPAQCEISTRLIAITKDKTVLQEIASLSDHGFSFRRILSGSTHYGLALYVLLLGHITNYVRISKRSCGLISDGPDIGTLLGNDRRFARSLYSKALIWLSMRSHAIYIIVIRCDILFQILSFRTQSAVWES